MLLTATRTLLRLQSLTWPLLLSVADSPYNARPPDQAALSVPMASQDCLPDLIARSALRDREAFALLYRQAAPTLYGLLLKLVRDRDLAADLLQEGFVRIWQRAGDYRPQLGQPFTWMGSIIRHLAIDHLRRGHQHCYVHWDDTDWALVADAGSTPEQSLRTGQEDAALARCLETLEPEPRRAVLLAYYEGLTHDLIAKRLGRPLGTIKAWVRRSLQRLKNCLGETV